MAAAAPLYESVYDTRLSHSSDWQPPLLLYKEVSACRPGAEAGLWVGLRERRLQVLHPLWEWAHTPHDGQLGQVSHAPGSQSTPVAGYSLRAAISQHPVSRHVVFVVEDRKPRLRERLSSLPKVSQAGRPYGVPS